MNILLVGSKGQVGQAILKEAPKIAPKEWKFDLVSRDDVDLSDITAVRQLLNEYAKSRGAPTYIINAAAYTKVDLAESNPVECAKLNTELPMVLAQFAKAWKAKLIHYSTDYVYSGDSKDPYLESDQARPLSVYGKTKWFGDQQVQSSGCEYLIFRTSWVYSATGKNFLRTMLKLGAEKESISVVADQWGSPTSANDIAKITLSAIKNTTAPNSRFPSGIYHLANSDYCTWFGFAEAIFEEARERGLPLTVKEVIPIETKDYPTAAKRPLNSRLNLGKLDINFGLKPRPWREALKDVMDEVH